MRFIGAAGWDNAAGATRPGAMNFGGGEAKLFVEMKQLAAATTATIEAHWYGEGGTPVKEIRIVHSWQQIFIYVKVGKYARYTGVFLETNSTPRIYSGSPFYFTPANSQLSNIDSITNNVVAPKKWSINSGSYEGNGFGMDLDSGNLLLMSNNIRSVSASTRIPICVNGELKFIQYQDFADAVRILQFKYAGLPAPSTDTYSLVFCTDTTRKPAMPLLYASNNGLGYPVHNLTDAWRPV